MEQTRDDTDGAIQLGVDAITEHLAELGLTLSIERDFAELRRFLESKNTFVNPTFDPDAVDLGRDDFWLLLRQPDGLPVASTAERVFEHDDLEALIRTGRFWRREGFGKPGTIPEELPHDLSEVPDAFSHSGSTFVDRGWRGRGLSMLLTYLSRGLSFRNHGIGTNTGFVREHLKNSPVPRRSYGYPHIALCWDRYFPPLDSPDRIYVCWIHRHEFARSCRGLPEHEAYPVPLPLAQVTSEQSPDRPATGPARDLINTE